MSRRFILLLALVLLTAGCAQSPRTEVPVASSHRASGLYLLVYSTDQQMRVRFEDQLAADLKARDFKAFRSYPDLPDVRTASRKDVVNAANARRARFVLVVEEVAQGETGVVSSAGRITQENPTLRDFYEMARPAGGEPGDRNPVFVEASAFLLQGDRAELVWSGTAWPLDGDPITGLSETIANAIEKARHDLEQARG